MSGCVKKDAGWERRFPARKKGGEEENISPFAYIHDTG
jgi:hypothetical protein